MTWQGSGTGAPGEPDDDATRTDIPIPGQPVPPPTGPPDAPPAGLPPAPAPQAPAPAPWAAPVAAGGGWGSVPPDSGRFAVPGAPGLVYAGAGPRLVAYIVDAVILGVVGAIIALPFTASVVSDALSAGALDPANPVPMLAPVAGVSTIIALVLEAAYFSLLWASSGRATIGMRLLKLQVGDATTGNRIPIATAFRRWLGFGAWLNLIAFVPLLGAFASLAVLAWEVVLLVTTASHPQKMGLHDRFANTAMVRPANAGSGGVILGCIVIAIAIALLSIVALIFLGSQVSSILSAAGESV